MYDLKELLHFYYAGNINLSEDFLKNAKSGDFCFVENKNLKDFEDKIEKIYVFQWNRDYPADFFFDIDLKSGKWKNTYVEELVVVMSGIGR